MKKSALLLLLLVLTLGAFSQDYSKLKDVTFSSPADYKNGEAKVEECARYILNQSYKENELNKMYCIQFIMKWMEGTPDYTFALGSDFADFCKNDTELGSVYMASLSIAAVDKNSDSKSADELTLKAREIFIDYCADPAHKVKKNKAIKKAIESQKS